MSDSTTLVKGQISQNSNPLYNEPVYLAVDSDLSSIKHKNKTTHYSGKNYPTKLMFFVYILLLIPPDEYFRCVGSLMTDRWVLTAASCVSVRKIHIDNIRCTVSKGEFYSYFEKRIKNTYDVEIDLPLVEERRVIYSRIHPKFKRETAVFNIAIMRVKKPFTENVFLDLAEKPLESTIKNCWVFGLGLEPAKIQIIATVIVAISNVTVKPTTECNPPAQGSFLCAKYNAKDTCQGDPGIPLICNGKMVGMSTKIEVKQGIQLLYDQTCKGENEYYFTPMFENFQWIKNTIIRSTPPDGCISIYFNNNWVLITLLLVSIS